MNERTPGTNTGQLWEQSAQGPAIHLQESSLAKVMEIISRLAGGRGTKTGSYELSVWVSRFPSKRINALSIS